MPGMHDAPLRRLQPEVAASGPWAEHLRGIGSARDILAPERYWDVLRPHAKELNPVRFERCSFGGRVPISRG